MLSISNDDDLDIKRNDRIFFAKILVITPFSSFDVILCCVGLAVERTDFLFRLE